MKSKNVKLRKWKKSPDENCEKSSLTIESNDRKKDFQEMCTKKKSEKKSS